MDNRSLQSVRISVADEANGEAEVYLPDGRRLGSTPFDYRGTLHSQTQLVLKRSGYRDKVVNFDITVRRREYVIPMEKIQR